MSRQDRLARIAFHRVSAEVHKRICEMLQDVMAPDLDEEEKTIAINDALFRVIFQRAVHGTNYNDVAPVVVQMQSILNEHLEDSIVPREEFDS